MLEERVRRPQTLQALVEFQLKVVNRQQTITIIGAICLIGGSSCNYQQNNQDGESGEKNEESEHAPKGQGQHGYPTSPTYSG